MSINKSTISSNQGKILANTGFTDWLWVAMEGDGSLTTPRRDATGGSVAFSQSAGTIGAVYETPFEATMNSTERIAYGDTADAFGSLCRLDNMTGGWLIQLSIMRHLGTPSAGQEFIFSYGQSGDTDGLWTVKQSLSTILATFVDGDANAYSPASWAGPIEANKDLLVAMAFNMNDKTCSLFAASASADLAMPRSTGASFASVAINKLPSSGKSYGLCLNARFNTNVVNTAQMLGSKRTKDTADEVFSKHSIVIRAEGALTKTSADVGELLGDLLDSLPNLPAVLENWGSS